MRVEVPLPSMGEDAEDSATVAFWVAGIGDTLAEGDDLLELTTDKAAFTVPCPQDGILLETVVAEGDEVSVGDVICVLET